MNSKEIARKVRCGACGGKIDRLNMVVLNRKATWKYPTGGNVMTGESGRAIAMLCDRCVKLRAKIREAVEWEFDHKQQPTYHLLATLEPLALEKTYTLITPRHGLPGIHCLMCGLVSWCPADVAERYCSRCKRFHDDPQPTSEANTW